MTDIEKSFLSKKLAFVLFYASWCPHCTPREGSTIQALHPIYKKLENHLTALQVPEFAMIDLDVDDDRELSQKYGVKGLPTILVFSHGHLIGKAEGLRSPKDIALKEFVQPYLTYFYHK